MAIPRGTVVWIQNPGKLWWKSGFGTIYLEGYKTLLNSQYCKSCVRRNKTHALIWNLGRPTKRIKYYIAFINPELTIQTLG